MANTIQQKLEAGIAAVRRGDRLAARRLLESVTRDDPRNEAAWMWLASVAASRSERREALERVVAINPDNDRAREALNQLNRLERRGGGTNATSDEDGESRGGLNPLNLVLGVVIALVFVAVLTVVSLQNADNDEEDAPIAVVNTPIPTIPLPPTRAVVIVPREQLTAQYPTLPPTWTPVPTVPSMTPIPTETPYPLTGFEALFTSLEDGAAQPGLFYMRGDGSGVDVLGEGLRDVTYDPSGRQVAFAREVQYDDAAPEPADPESTAEPGDVALSVAPPVAVALELFVAPVDAETGAVDVDAAVQLTTLRTGYVGSPTWSPDGRFLIFVADADGDEDLWLVQSDGEGLRLLTDNQAIDRDPAWSPVLGSVEVVFASDVESPGQLELYRFDVPTVGEAPVFERMTNASNSSYQPAWSPRGETLAFISDRRGDPDLYLMDVATRGVTLLTLSDSDAEDRQPGFTPDGRWVSFISNRLDDRFQSYLIARDGSVLTRLTQSSGNDLTLHYRPILRLRLD